MFADVECRRRILWQWQNGAAELSEFIFSSFTGGSTPGQYHSNFYLFKILLLIFVFSSRSTLREEEKLETGVLRRVYGSTYSKYYAATGYNWPGGERKGGGE